MIGSVLVAVAFGGAGDRRVELVARGGGAAYSPFAFATVGAEARVRVVAGLRVAATAEAWGTRRVPPPEVQLEENVYSEWNWIQPVGLGAVYQVSAGPVDPYAGAELLVAKHAEDAWTLGGRARAGVDWLFVPHVGLDLGLSAGAWSGKGWSKLQDGAKDAGPVLQGTLGVVVGF